MINLKPTLPIVGSGFFLLSIAVLFICFLRGDVFHLPTGLACSVLAIFSSTLLKGRAKFATLPCALALTFYWIAVAEYWL